MNNCITKVQSIASATLLLLIVSLHFTIAYADLLPKYSTTTAGGNLAPATFTTTDWVSDVHYAVYTYSSGDPIAGQSGFQDFGPLPIYVDPASDPADMVESITVLSGEYLYVFQIDHDPGAIASLTTLINGILTPALDTVTSIGYTNDSDVNIFGLGPGDLDSPPFTDGPTKASLDTAGHAVIYSFPPFGAIEPGDESFTLFFTSTAPPRFYASSLFGGESDTQFVPSPDNDFDDDGIYDDGDFSGITGDNPCTGGNTANCDDNCVDNPNPDQADADADGFGNVCDIQWYDSNWQYRQVITIDSAIAEEDLSNFPVLVRVTDQSNPVFTSALANGDDIMFTLSDNVTKLDHEIEYYQNTGTRELSVWVRVPFLYSNSDTVIHMYYGNSGAGNQANPEGVWDSNHVMVQHLGETAGQHMDSTLNNNDSNFINVTQQGQTATAKIGGADEFDAVDDYVSIPDPGVDSPLDLSGGGSITLSAWIYARGPGEGIVHGGIINKSNGSKKGYTLRIDGANCSNPGDITAIGTRAGNWYGPCGTPNNVNANSWDHVSYVYDSTTSDHYLYINGVLDVSLNLLIDANDSQKDLRIGEWSHASFDGFIDEVRISNNARSAEWIKASFNNQNMPENYLTFGAETQEWYDSNWQYRQVITIDSAIAEEDLSNFPVLVRVTDQSNPVFTSALANGDDIMFTLSDNVTKLDHEIEYYQNTGTRELSVWVRVPFLYSNSDTVIHMYYGNSGAGNQANPEGVWDSNHVMVQHLGETAGQHMDSTLNNNDSNFINVTQQGQTATAKIGGADEFDAVDDYVSIPDPGVDSPLDLSGGGSITLSAWIYARGPGEGIVHGGIINKSNGSKKGYTLRIDGANCSNPGDITAIGTRAGNWYGPCGTPNNVNANSWDHVSYVYDSTTSDHYLYINGVLDVSLNLLIDANDSQKDLRIGEWSHASFDGFIDEVRISNNARSAEWIKASFNNQNMPENYLTFGAEYILN